MQISKIIATSLPEVKIIQFSRFLDERGYFTEQFRKSDLLQNSAIPFLNKVKIVQANESFSKRKVIRGLHFQWNPFMGKLVRVITGHMLDAFLDLRKGSPTFGKIGLFELKTENQAKTTEWIWLPPGFAHGCCFLAPTYIEYFCSGQYAPNSEAGISPLAQDLDWSLCPQDFKAQFLKIAQTTELMTEKDRQGLSLTEWKNDPRSENFIFGKC